MRRERRYVSQSTSGSVPVTHLMTFSILTPPSVIRAIPLSSEMAITRVTTFTRTQLVIKPWQIPLISLC